MAVARQAPLTVEQHLLRAEVHRVDGETKAAVGDEWGAVSLFYSAYHLVRAALLSDPIWTDARSRARINVNLTPDDKNVTRHHGGWRRSGRVWGVNELVALLYPAIQADYERLHQASCNVRYELGLPNGALADLPGRLAAIRACSDAGTLIAPVVTV